MSQSEKAAVLAVEATSAAVAGTINLIAPSAACISAPFDAAAFSMNLFWTFSELDFSNWEDIAEVALGSAGYSAMIYTESADCIQKIRGLKANNMGYKTLQTTTQAVALSMFALDGILQGVNQDWNKFGETVI